MPTFRKGRSWIVVVAVLAMVVSVLALPAVAAAPAVGTVEHPADWSACVSAPSAGFGDTAGSFAATDIDCIAMYEVTLGTGAGVYSPGDVVTREQMALFLARAAGPAGLTLPAAADQGFTDIAGLPQASQDAINQIAKLGVTKGTTATTYSPGDAVSRYQMALFLVRFLEAWNGTANLASSMAASGFTDTGSVSFEGYNAIETAYDHGITKGTTKTLFSPFAAVTREQMAAFIGRTLAHTNAAPAGVTMQASKTSGDATFQPDIRWTVRDADFAPVPFALVDVFWVTDQKDNPPLKTDGTCDATAASLGGFSNECEIDLGDNEVDVKGNLEGTLPGVPADKTYTFWAWTGDVGDDFDLDTTQVSALDLSGTTPVDLDTKLTNDLATDASYVAFGDTVTFTFQLVDQSGTTDVNLALADEEIDIDWTETTYVDDVQVSYLVKSTTLKTDATGKVTFPVTAADPDAADAEDPFEADYVEFDIDIEAPGDDADVAGFNLDFTDEAPYVETFKVSTPSEYADNTTSAASVVVTATVLDQYGDGISGEAVRLLEDFGSTTEDESNTRSTNSSGKASFSFTANDTGGIEAAFYACWDEDGIGFDYDECTANLPFYFAEEATDGDDGGAILVWDDDNDIAVVDTGVPTWVKWLATDQFGVDGSPATQATFEATTTEDNLDWLNYGSTTSPAAYNLNTPAA